MFKEKELGWLSEWQRGREFETSTGPQRN